MPLSLSRSSRYDVYTPTRNIVFHDYGKQANGHGENEWFKRQRDRFRKGSIVRAKTILQIPGGESDANDQANLGLYGLGRRRSLEQLSEFVNIDLKNGRGNVGPHIKCSGHEWVPYDASISPQENLFANPDNLDPQPEYPLRTKLQYYQQVEQAMPLYDNGLVAGDTARSSASGVDHFGPDRTAAAAGMPSAGTLFVFWVFGLVVWYIMFMGPGAAASNKAGGRPARSPARKKGSNVYKDV